MKGEYRIIKFIEKIKPIKKISGLFFYCPTTVALWRVNTFFTKEPETIEWINTFEEGETFWDVGANIGIYSLYAYSRGIKVLSFEPDAANYHILNKNIELNKFKIPAYCIAFNDKTEIGSLDMQKIEVGAALKIFTTQTNPLLFNQGMIAFNIDDFIERFNIVTPDHIKIDVDGMEDKIIKGALGTLKKVKSILIEFDVTDPAYKEKIKLIEDIGFKLEARLHAPIFDEGKWSSYYNYIFIKKK